MTIAIILLILLAYVLMSFEHVTNINKATIAVFAGVAGWILLVSGPTSAGTFARYAADLCSIVLYLLATMNIVSVLHTNGCFDFIATVARSRSSRVTLWTLVAFTWLISVNLDNLTTTVLMLTIMSRIVQHQRHRMWVGAAIVIAANCGGAATVIGDMTSLVVWTKGAVTPTSFSAALLVPTLLATAVATALIARSLPEHMDLIRPTASYRGNTSPLRLWQRMLLLVIGLGGLWFIPTFHRITQLPPFFGALCVLGVLWVLHEMLNHRRIRSGQPLSGGSNLLFQFASLQTIMYFVGIFLCVSLFIETGVMHSISSWCDEWIHNIYIMSIAMGALSAVLDNIALVLTAINIYPVADSIGQLSQIAGPAYAHAFMPDGQYWHLIIYSGCVAGCLLPVGNVCGYALMKAEEVTIMWYMRHIMPKVLVAWLLGLGAYFLIDFWIR